MKIKAFKETPEFLTIILQAKSKVVKLVGRPLHMLQRIDAFQCEAAKQMKSYLNYFQEDENAVKREGTPWEGLPANRVEVSYASDKLSPRTRTTLSHILRLLFPQNVVGTILERFSNGESFQLTTAGGMQGTINFLREWYLTKKLLRSAYPEARDLDIQQDISEWHNPSRRNLEEMLRLRELLHPTAPCLSLDCCGNTNLVYSSFYAVYVPLIKSTHTCKPSLLLHLAR